MGQLKLQALKFIAAPLAIACVDVCAYANDASSTGQGLDLSPVGKVLGLMLFGYLVMRFSRRRDAKDQEDEGSGLSRRVKPLHLGLVILVVVVVMMWATS